MADDAADGVRLVKAPKDGIVDIRQHVLPHLRDMAAGSRGRFTTEDMFAAVASGRIQLWLVWRNGSLAASITTELIQYPQLRAVRFVGCVGADWRLLTGILEQIAARAKVEAGVEILEALCPRKYRHMLPGYTSSHMLFERTA
jgi:hypothetical protein